MLELLTQGALSAGFPEARIHRLPMEDQAAEACLRGAKPGDLVVLLPTEVESVWAQVMDFDGRHEALPNEAAQARQTAK